MIIASYFGYQDTVKELIKYEADLNIQEAGGKTALIFAVAYKKTVIANWLVDAFADVTLLDSYKADALIWASRNNLPDLVYKMLKRDADPKNQQTNGMTALIWASFNGYDTIVDYLIDNKAGLNLYDKAGETALHKAANNGHLQIVTKLLLAKCDWDI